MACIARLKKEVEQLQGDPGPGISAFVVNDNIKTLEAQIIGPAESPFSSGTFTLSIEVPDRYPFEPPRVRFLTPIYHPNIDSDGRICLDTLKMQPQGSWSPSININTLLLTIRLLMATPNADDGLVADITEEYRRDINLWKRKAAEHTKRNAEKSVNGEGNGDFEIIDAITSKEGDFKRKKDSLTDENGNVDTNVPDDVLHSKRQKASPKEDVST